MPPESGEARRVANDTVAQDLTLLSGVVDADVDVRVLTRDLQPLAGARVQLTRIDPDASGQPRHERIWFAHTNSQGTLEGRVPVPRNAERFRLLVHHPHYQGEYTNEAQREVYMLNGFLAAPDAEAL